VIRSLVAEWRDGLVALSPRQFPYGRFVLALVVGGIGAAIFNHYRLPLPWMMGAMVLCMLATLVRLPVAAPSTVRPPMLALIGVMLGSGFTPAVISSLPHWIPTMVGLFAFILVCGVTCVAYFRKIAGLDMATAYFSGMPGGLAEMIVLGEEKGADTRVIALVQSARVFMIVMTLPFLVQWLSGVDLGDRSRGNGISLFDVTWSTPLWLGATALAGALLAHALRLPSKYLLGPMLVSALIHATGMTDFALPWEVIAGAQLIMGCVIGCRFAGTPTAQILRILGLSLGSTFILLAVTIIFAMGISQVSDYGMIPLILAYSPGGLAEMSLIALALQVEVAFVAAHHIVRVFAVMLGARLLFRWIDRTSE
jgi:membrane AbrB-like protein